MEKYLLVFIGLLICSIGYLKLAVKYKIIDKPNERSSHKKITVRGGGILFTLSIILFFILNDYQYPYFVLGVFVISIISFLDDIYTLSSKIRFPFQLIAVFLILFEIGIQFVPVYSFLFFLIFGVGIINMFNFMDGINGITGLYSLSVLLGFYIINQQEAVVSSELLDYAIISIVVFGFYNFRKKALFFAGDIGSISIGILIFFIGLKLAIQLNTPLILFLVIVYGADTSITLLYRKFFTNESVFEAHRHHIYQKLVDVMNFSHLKVSSIYAITQVFVNFIIFKTYKLKLEFQIIIFGVLCFIFFGIYIYLFNKLKTKEANIEFKS